MMRGIAVPSAGAFAWLDRFQALITASANVYGVDPALVAAVIQQESSGDPTAQSGAGAVGLMQVVPLPGRPSATALLDPATNIDAGTAYLSECIGSFPGQLPLAVAAYNAGVGGVRAAGGDLSQLPAETQIYVPRVLNYYNQAQTLFASGAPICPPGEAYDDTQGACQPIYFGTDQPSGYSVPAVLAGLAIVAGAGYVALRQTGVLE